MPEDPRTIGTDTDLGTQPDSLHVESALRLDQQNPSARFIVPGQEGTFAFPHPSQPYPSETARLREMGMNRRSPTQSPATVTNVDRYTDPLKSRQIDTQPPFRSNDFDSADNSKAQIQFSELRRHGLENEDLKELRDYLVRAHMPLVVRLARRFKCRGEPLDDLIQVGAIGLIKSIDRFDPERGVEFSAFATPTIVGEIKRHFRDHGWAVHVPRRLQELRITLAEATADLTQQYDRPPTIEELATKLQTSEDEIIEGIKATRAYSAVSLDAADAEHVNSIADRLASEGRELDEIECRESLRELLRDLPYREARILLLRYFLDMSQTQIAQEVGLSQMHISRLLSRTLTQLREQLSQ
ncbi:SigB/SigF/SigG family RNA polymerase sigma factor [Streptomyces murinus]|uniref:SigB/SigF/SigG family RNA polymerase sigma factor n=1 Tax=Streptomyces murinus TaxID=33900 RepID=UPI003F45D07A